MKAIIIEGIDNCGKDTLISKIIEKYPTSLIIHCSKPYSKHFSSNEQDMLFETYANNLVGGLYSNTHIVILNRSWIGEYVYGTLYRGRDKQTILNNILDIEKKLKNIDITYIQLLSSSPQLALEHEDGKSLSVGKLENVKNEIKLFEEVFNASTIANKHIIYVNKEGSDEFKPKGAILNEVLKYIGA